MSTVTHNSKIIVQKFGGTSVGSAARIARVARIITNTLKLGVKPVIVVSAMSGTTNSLLDLCHEVIAEVEQADSSSIFNQISSNKHYSSLSSSRLKYLNCRYNTLIEKDAALATGECLASALLAIALNSFSYAACSLQFWQIPIITNSSHGKALVKEIDVRAVHKMLDSGVIPIITGFTGVSETTGRVTTLGRGGSDTTALLLAAALNAKRCDIYTDVNGVYSADPRIIPQEQLKKFPIIDARTMLALSASGAKVLATRCMEICYRYKIDVRVLSSFDCSEDGTSIYHTAKDPIINNVDEQGRGAKKEYEFNEVREMNNCVQEGLEGVRVESIVVNKSLFLLTMDEDSWQSGLSLLIEKEVEIMKIIHHTQGVTKSVRCILPLNEVEEVKNILNQADIRYHINMQIGAVSLVGYGIKNHAKLLQILTQKLESFCLDVVMLEIGELVMCAYVNSIDLHHFVESLHNALIDEFKL
ncbi:Aspartokinase [Rickettsiales endosymbiont of Paramecium tredecaurelia]|uniref:aspartate kinase n=1 Tax=Candidatus Sarmatiella mevalonica TaxID=2770581 RepID=UPI001920EF96|nr:aspartate kinase [Candidatus Sarmatiella mevalonica]MBL3284207.1 Aspartokinase [Candidatus Sarmatiella mevalonica]